MWSIRTNDFLKHLNTSFSHISLLICISTQKDSTISQSRQQGDLHFDNWLWKQMCLGKKMATEYEGIQWLGVEENKRWDRMSKKKKWIWGGGTGRRGGLKILCLFGVEPTLIPQSLKENESTSILFWPTFTEKNSSFSP